MRWLNKRISLPLLVLLFISIALSLLAADYQTAWVKRVVDGDTLLLTNGERTRLIEIYNQRGFPV